MKKHIPLINLLALCLSALFHLLSYTDAMPHTLAEVRDSRALLFLPDNSAILTWLVIYLSLVIFAIYLTRPAAEELNKTVAPYFFFVHIGKITWTILFIYGSIWMSTLAMIMTLAAFILLYTRLNLRRGLVKRIEFWTAHVPVSIGLAWISFLTPVNVAAALHDTGYVSSLLGISADIWAVILLVGLGTLAASFLYFNSDIVFALTMAWGALAIFLRPFDTALYSSLNVQTHLVDAVALGVFAALFGLSLLRAFVPKARKPNLILG